MTTEKQKPDYQIAADELRALFASLNLPVEISSPIGEVKDGWPCISYTVAVKGESFTYSLGIGHVKWPKENERFYQFVTPKMPSGDHWDNVVQLTRKHATIKEEYKARFALDQATAAAWLAKRQKVQPHPAEVLANAASDGEGAEDSFENWCQDFGYDSDSMKARATYDACTENGKKARRVLGAENARKFAELSSQL
jgi:hypothetical protein